MQLFVNWSLGLAKALEALRDEGVLPAPYPGQTLDVHVGSADLADLSNPENRRDTVQDLADKILGGQQGQLLIGKGLVRREDLVVLWQDKIPLLATTEHLHRGAVLPPWHLRAEIHGRRCVRSKIKLNFKCLDPKSRCRRLSSGG
eukprot:SAG22_NODE_60_length_23423_cov_8.445250_10_plen_145_part_00